MKANYDLSDKKVIITGGASGIGLGTAQAFLQCGATVAVNDLPGEKLDNVIRTLSDQGYPVIKAPGDIGDAKLAQDTISQAIDQMDGLDYLINNAGTPGTTAPIAVDDFERQDEAFWHLLLNVNLLGPYRCTKAAVSALRASKGAIVNTASVSVFGGGGSSSVYCATKAGLVMLTNEWARSLAPDVRVNAIAPGAVESDWMCKFEGSDLDYVDTCPMQRKGTPEDYAEAIVFLAAGASYVTGQTLNVDGGLST